MPYTDNNNNNLGILILFWTRLVNVKGENSLLTWCISTYMHKITNLGKVWVVEVAKYD